MVLILLPTVVSSFIELIRKPRDRLWSQHFESAMNGLGRRLAEVGLAMASLPYRAAIHLSAIFVSADRSRSARPRWTKTQGNVLCGLARETWCYSHLSGVRFDAVNPEKHGLPIFS